MRNLNSIAYTILFIFFVVAIWLILWYVMPLLSQIALDFTF